jgi:hypothetical protein
MSDEIKNVTEQKTRRSAIKTAAQVAVTAPAVGLLLSAGTKSASALVHYGDDYVKNIVSGDDGVDDTSVSVNTGDDYYTY